MILLVQQLLTVFLEVFVFMSSRKFISEWESVAIVTQSFLSLASVIASRIATISGVVLFKLS